MADREHWNLQASQKTTNVPFKLEYPEYRTWNPEYQKFSSVTGKLWIAHQTRISEYLENVEYPEYLEYLECPEYPEYIEHLGYLEHLEYQEYLEYSPDRSE